MHQMAKGSGMTTGRAVLAGHLLAGVAAIMLVAAAIGWLAGDAAVIGPRTGLVDESAAAPALAAVLGAYKGLLDLWPLPIALWAALRRDPATAALVWAVAVVIIPLGDVVVQARIGRSWGEALVHVPYLLVMSGAAAAYAVAARRAR